MRVSGVGGFIDEVGLPLHELYVDTNQKHNSVGSNRNDLIVENKRLWSSSRTASLNPRFYLTYMKRSASLRMQTLALLQPIEIH